MDLPSKLLSFYLSLANEGVPISLNIWTEKGSEGHFFRISSSISKKKEAFSKLKSEEFQNFPKFNPSTPPPVTIRSADPPDRPAKVKEENLPSPPLDAPPSLTIRSAVPPDRPAKVKEENSPSPRLDAPSPPADVPSPPPHISIPSKSKSSVSSTEGHKHTDESDCKINVPTSNRFNVLQNEDECTELQPEHQNQCTKCYKPIPVDEEPNFCVCDDCVSFGRSRCNAQLCNECTNL